MSAAPGDPASCRTSGAAAKVLAAPIPGDICALTAGLGIALLPRLSVAGKLADGWLVEVPWTVPFQVFTQVAWHREIRIDPRFSVLLDASARATAEQVADAGARPTGGAGAESAEPVDLKDIPGA
ncbi:substrate-binding domain-containing protein [Amycolatopsis sp. NBC_00348]|uniref:LysR substrate-binding domain-containing protein n=1 Tax=Amycolatopsis sp. NBC_00348 TaxID=2975956 RepID=UPI002E25D65D